MARARRPAALAEHAPENAMDDPDEVARFYDRCSDLMRALLDALAAAPGRPRPFGEIEDAIGWPRRRIASVLGGVSHLRHTEFGGARPYRFLDARDSTVGPVGDVDGRDAGAGGARRPRRRGLTGPPGWRRACGGRIPLSGRCRGASTPPTRSRRAPPRA